MVLGAIYVAGGAIAGALSAGAGALGLSAAGFTSGGVAAGSIAAGVQAGIGNVAGGSIFAMLQSVGATGAIVSTGPVGVCAGVGALVVLLLI